MYEFKVFRGFSRCVHLRPTSFLFLQKTKYIMAETDLCPMAAKPNNEIQPRTVGEANLALLKSKRMCDVTFVFRNNPDGNPAHIQAHRFCLRARSLVFDLMFKTCKSGDLAEIEITDVNPDIFQAFLEFIYGDKLDVGMAVALHLLPLAKKYRVQPLMEKCEELLRNEVQIHDAVQVFEATSTYKLTDLKAKAAMLLARYIDTISTESYFLEAKEETMVELFSRNDLMVNEVELFRLAVKWGQHHIQGDSKVNRLKAVLTKILPLIRFPNMTAEEFAIVVIPTNILPMDDIVEICSFLAMPKDQRIQDKGSLRYSTEPRIPTGQLMSFCNSKASTFQLCVRAGQYVETFSFLARVQETQLLSKPMRRKPIITGVNLYLPECVTPKPKSMDFVLHITEFQDSQLQSEGILNRRRMFVQCDAVGGRVVVNVDPPLELADGHYYGIALKDDTCHPPSKVFYSWNVQSDFQGGTILVRGHMNSIEICEFHFPYTLLNYTRNQHVRLQAITGVTVVVP